MSRRAALVAFATACALSTQGCGFAVKHPAITAGIAAGTLGFTTCKLASDNWAACGYVGGGAAAVLGLVTAAALWLGGDGDSSGLDEPLPPLVEEGPPPSANEPPANPPAANPPAAKSARCESAVDEPTVDEPTVDEPTVDEPTVDEPTELEPARRES
jgi:hypothetical protein